MGAWIILERMLDEIDMKAEITRMMASAEFKKLMQYVTAERLTTDQREATVAVLQALVKYSDPKKQAQSVRRALTQTGVVPPLPPGAREPEDF